MTTFCWRYATPIVLLSVALGNQFTAQVNHYIAIKQEEGVKLLDGANYYWFFTAAMAITAVVYLGFANFYKGQTFIHDGDESIKS